MTKIKAIGPSNRSQQKINPLYAVPNMRDYHVRGPLGSGFYIEDFSGRSWYVRPSGGSYGTEDGTSYANAWDGFSNIVWASIQPGDTLWVAGSHDEKLVVGASGLVTKYIYIKSVVADPYTITGSLTRDFCIDAQDETYIEFDGGTLTSAIDSCLYLRNGTYVVRNMTATTATGVGAQAFQNEIDSIATYYNCSGLSSTDDSFSLHANAIAVCYDCTFTGSAQGVNGIGTTSFTAHRCTIAGTISVQPDSDADFTINDSFINTNFNANSSVALKLNRCRITDNGAALVSTLGKIIMTECRVVGASRIEIRSANNTVQRCLFESSLTRSLNTTNSGDVDVNYCVWKLTTAIYAVRGNSTGQIRLNNCSIVGAANVGLAVEGFGTNVAGSVELTNTILYDLQNAYTTDADGIIFADYVNRFDITTVTSGAGPITQTNTITTDPAFVDITNLDFSTGANTKNVGTSTGITTGITYTGTNWGDANTVPVVATAEQAGTYDLGAYL